MSWRYDEGAIVDGQTLIARTPTPTGRDDAKSRSRGQLMAAAPELLEVAELAMKLEDARNMDVNELLRRVSTLALQARDAIAKAKKQ